MSTVSHTITPSEARSLDFWRELINSAMAMIRISTAHARSIPSQRRRFVSVGFVERTVGQVEIGGAQDVAERDAGFLLAPRIHDA